MTTAIALSGGGANGDFEVGVLRFLYDIGVRPDILSTTSVGSVNGLKLAEGEGRAPFYRLLNGSGDHFYTASLEERDNAIRAVGYHSEGVACDVPTAQAPITVALWRLLKTN